MWSVRSEPGTTVSVGVKQRVKHRKACMFPHLNRSSEWIRRAPLGTSKPSGLLNLSGLVTFFDQQDVAKLMP